MRPPGTDVEVEKRGVLSRVEMTALGAPLTAPLAYQETYLSFFVDRTDAFILPVFPSSEE